MAAEPSPLPRPSGPAYGIAVDGAVAALSSVTELLKAADCGQILATHSHLPDRRSTHQNSEKNGDPSAAHQEYAMALMTMIKHGVRGLPGMAALASARVKLRQDYGAFPPGHYYSPIPNWREVRLHESEIFGDAPRCIPGIELNESGQLALLGHFSGYYADMPFKAHKVERLRYYFDNPWYSYSDAIFLHCMLRHLKPKRIIEIGSGFSSCVVLDTNELFFDESIETTFIDRDLGRLMSLFKEGDRNRITLIPEPVQRVSLDKFESLEANDILFVDSSHVGKIREQRHSYPVRHSAPALAGRLRPLSRHLLPVRIPKRLGFGWACVERGIPT